MLFLYGGVAQLGEHLPCKQGVKGSIPFISTTKKEGHFLDFPFSYIVLNYILLTEVIMQTKRYKPLIDKMFWWISIPTAAIMIALTIIMAMFETQMLFLMLPMDVLVAYVLIAPLFGYVELREHSVFIKYGFLLKKEIPYDTIRSVKKANKFYSESMMALKNAVEHVNITYHTFDVTTVSVVTNDAFIRDLNDRCHLAMPAK